MTSGIASSSCDLPATPGQVVSVWGHQHEIGKSVQMILNPDTPDEVVMLDIPNWDFDWQLNYAPVDDVILERGDTIRIECVWDRAGSTRTPSPATCCGPKAPTTRCATSRSSPARSEHPGRSRSRDIVQSFERDASPLSRRVIERGMMSLVAASPL